MARGILWIVLTVCALLLAGCSSHPPSAAQFMNVKEQGGYFAIGGALRAGDVYSGDYQSIPDYKAEEGFWNADLSLLVRYGNIVFGTGVENVALRNIVGYHWEYVGLQCWGSFGMAAPVGGDLSFYGGMMLIEEYPMTEKFRIGTSEHISHNAYTVDELGFPSTATYWEVGTGIYLAYGDFSLEFRYGREIDDSRNRFYFMINYALLTPD